MKTGGIYEQTLTFKLMVRFVFLCPDFNSRGGLHTCMKRELPDIIGLRTNNRKKVLSSVYIIQEKKIIMIIFFDEHE